MKIAFKPFEWKNYATTVIKNNNGRVDVDVSSSIHCLVAVHGGNKYVPGKLWSQQKAVNMRKAILSPAKSSFHKWRNEVEFAAATGLHVMSTFTS